MGRRKTHDLVCIDPCRGRTGVTLPAWEKGHGWWQKGNWGFVRFFLQTYSIAFLIRFFQKNRIISISSIISSAFGKPRRGNLLYFRQEVKHLGFGRTHIYPQLSLELGKYSWGGGGATQKENTKTRYVRFSFLTYMYVIVRIKVYENIWKNIT